MGRRRLRFWSEVAAGTMFLLIAMLTLVSPEWIEIVFGADPDAGSGWAELVILAVAGCVAVTFAVLAIRERRSTRQISQAAADR